MFRAFLIGYYSPPTPHSNHEQRSLSSGSDRSRPSRSIGERRIDGPVPLLLTTSHPLSEEGWQFRQAPKMGCHACLGMRRRADQDRSGPEPGRPLNCFSAVIDDQRLYRLHASICEEACIVLWPFFEGVDQVSPIEAFRGRFLESRQASKEKRGNRKREDVSFW